MREVRDKVRDEVLGSWEGDFEFSILNLEFGGRRGELRRKTSNIEHSTSNIQHRSWELGEEMREVRDPPSSDGFGVASKVRDEVCGEDMIDHYLRNDY